MNIVKYLKNEEDKIDTKTMLGIFIFVFVLLPLITLLLIATPVLAISNPDSISMPYYKIFENVLEDGDMLIVAEGNIEYASEPTDYKASQAFLFELVDTDETTTIVSTTIKAYGDRPIGIYLTAARVDSLGIVSGTGYMLRITGNPLIFASSDGNTISSVLADSDYVDQELGINDDSPSENLLRNGMIVVAENMEETDEPGVGEEYLVTVQGYKYLTLDGGSLFIIGIPNLDDMCPILFQAGLEAMTADAPENTGSYALTLNPLQKWGQTVANGLTTLGSFLGINQALAGSVMLFIIVIMFAVFLYQKTESGISVLLMVAATPFIGAYLGLMPMALAFIFVIIIITLMGYFFWSRGAL